MRIHAAQDGPQWGFTAGLEVVLSGWDNLFDFKPAELLPLKSLCILQLPWKELLKWVSAHTGQAATDQFVAAAHVSWQGCQIGPTPKFPCEFTKNLAASTAVSPSFWSWCPDSPRVNSRGINIQAWATCCPLMPASVAAHSHGHAIWMRCACEEWQACLPHRPRRRSETDRCVVV